MTGDDPRRWARNTGLKADTTRVQVYCRINDKENWDQEADDNGYSSTSKYLYELIQEARAYREQGFLSHHQSEVEIEEFEWELGVSETEAASGDRSLRIWNEGDYDDGVTWGVHPVSVESGAAYEVTVTAQFWSESESFNTLRDAVMRLGPEPPEVEEDFPHPGVNTIALGETPYGGLREPLWLADGWREYRFEWTTPELSTNTLYLALGHAVIWEGDATHYIDDITVEFGER